MPRLYGFDDASRRRLRDDEVDPLRQMVSRALSNQSNQDVAVWANGEGYRGTLGGEWKDASVGRLFRNPAIAGLRYEDDGELVDAGHPGAITREEFEGLLEREKARSTKNPKPAHDYLLIGGACTCGQCAHALEGARTNVGTPGYRCRPKDKSGRGGCGEVRIDAELLEDNVGENVVAELLKPGIRAQISKAQDAVRSQVENLKRDIRDLESRQAELGRLYGNREISTEALVAGEREITANLKDIRSRLRYAEQMANFSLGQAKNLVRWWNTAPTASKRGIAMLLLEKVEVFPASARGVRTIEPGRVVLHWRKLSSLSRS
ncbi:recombinase family protein [Streptomyces turgidiscabies]|uniref:Recombinase n=1 Tax=Streptomyces turgidiscabies (strain Car8) TaxID=698760 RepID=L7F1Y5_STRT8|nr:MULTISPECIES: recombinase family protein [Streptomyces]ELP64991.1 recombinase [Streptomyces turgidiscabies Car8]MDX3497232.1 recombinase family protein [Streptomyces turgidiscabies]GAQ68672.1 recombinase [Streptomyces turgidiscabies]